MMQVAVFVCGLLTIGVGVAMILAAFKVGM